VPAALVAIILLVVATPVFLLFDVQASRILLGLWSAVALGIMGVSLRPREAQHVWRTLWMFAPIGFLPVLVMTVQILPVGYFAHPIWQSAASALNTPIFGTISAVPALTLSALFGYLSLLGLAVATVGVAIDRRRARALMRALVIETSLVAAALAILTIAAPSFFRSADRTVLNSSFAALCNLGLVLSAALVVEGLENWPARRRDVRSKTAHGDLWLGGAAVVVLLASPVLASRGGILVAGMVGVSVLLLAVLLHYVSAFRWQTRLLASSIFVATVLLMLSQFAQRAGDVFYHAATDTNQARSSIAQRMMADAGPLGTGAGTYPALVPIYQEFNDQFEVLAAPTSAVRIAVECGRFALVAFLLAAIFLAIALFWRALGRGRDIGIVAAGSGCAALIGLEIFSGTSLCDTDISILTAVILGLALGQSLSTARAQAT
jgi:hypothetical protein